MKTKIIALAVCLACISTPAYTTGLLEAKLAAVAGIAKGATLLGAGALAAKGAVLQGVGSLLAAKGAAISNVLADAAKPIEVPAKPIEISVPSIVLEQPNVANPCIANVEVGKPTVIPSKPSNPSGPLLGVDVDSPLLSAGIQVDSKPVASLLGDGLGGLLTTVDQTLGIRIGNTRNKPVLLTRSPIVYKLVRTPKFYPVPIY